LIILAVLAIVPLGVGAALSHGQPTITVQPTVAAAGSQITVAGSDIEAGEEFTITLGGLAGSTTLGQVTATGEGTAGGFTATFTIPANVAPGSYTVRAIAPDGDGTTADLTVTAPSDQASVGPAMMQEPSAAPHVIDRSKPIGAVVGIVAIALVSGGLGFWLVRTRK